MNFKRISAALLQGASLMVCANLALAQAQSAKDAPAPAQASQASTPPASASALRLVEQEAPGRDAQGNMRIQLINGGIKLPAKL